MTAEPEAPRPSGLAAAFADTFGREPAGVWAAPGRINLIGEHTDYNDGFALPLALPRVVAAAAAPRDDGMLLLCSRRPGDEPVRLRLEELAPGEASRTARGWSAYVTGVAWALRGAGCAVGGAEVMVDADLPAGAGLASSAALECAAALALDELWQLELPRDELARLAHRAENDFVGVPCGVMDQTAALRCTAGHGLFLDCRELSVEQVPLDPGGSGLALLVVNTRAAHRHAEGAYASRRRGCERAAATLGLAALRELGVEDLDAALARLDDVSARYVRHVVTENARVLEAVRHLRAGEVAAVGPLLTASHTSLRDDYRVSCPELDAAVEAALEAGALGARMTGGGFGGCAVALVSAGRESRDNRDNGAGAVASAVTQAFRTRGLAAPRSFPAVPSGGARRLSP